LSAGAKQIAAGVAPQVRRSSAAIGGRLVIVERSQAAAWLGVGFGQRTPHFTGPA